LLEEFWGQVTGCHLGIMSSVGGDQVQALNDLFSRSPEIDRLLHMQLVEKALKELSLDEAGAVALSSCISAQGSLSVEEKEWLQKILREKVWEMGVKSGRRPYQDYTALDSFLTDAVWDALQRGPFSSSSTILFQHVWSFGLRLPSEATSASMTAALEYFASEPKNLFALYCTLKTVKKMWTSFANQKRKSDDLKLLLGSLPSCPDDLPEEIGKRVTLKGPIVPSKIADLANSIPNRESHEAVKQYKLATQASTAASADPMGSFARELMKGLASLVRAGQEVPLQMLPKSGGASGLLTDADRMGAASALQTFPCREEQRNQLALPPVESLPSASAQTEGAVNKLADQAEKRHEEPKVACHDQAVQDLKQQMLPSEASTEKKNQVPKSMQKQARSLAAIASGHVLAQALEDTDYKRKAEKIAGVAAAPPTKASKKNVEGRPVKKPAAAKSSPKSKQKKGKAVQKEEKVQG